MNQNKKITKHIGILCAMPEEIGSTINNLEDVEIKTYGDLEIYSGNWKFPENYSKPFKVSLSVVWSGWGKVSSARASTRLISHMFNGLKIQLLLFTGVAGGINLDLKQWDIVIADELIQYDMDARPLFKKYEIPPLNNDRIKSDNKISEWVYKILKTGIKNKSLESFGNIYKGLIATADKFVNEKEDAENISKNIKDLLAVEMEGASVAQVAKQEQILFQIIRVISDAANESSHEDFNEFLIKYKYHSSKLISALINNIDSAFVSVSIKRAFDLF